MAQAKAKSQSKVRHTTSSAGSVAAKMLAGEAPSNQVGTATGATLGKKQKINYDYDASVKLNADAAKGSRQKAHLKHLQAAFGNRRTMAGNDVVKALQEAGHPNPTRVWRQSVRANVLVKA